VIHLDETADVSPCHDLPDDLQSRYAGERRRPPFRAGAVALRASEQTNRPRGRKLLARLGEPGLSWRPAGGRGDGMTHAGEDAVQGAG
jgi:hypothetical protein